MPIGEAHGHLPDSPDPQRQGSAVREPEPDNLNVRVRAHQTWRPVLDDSAHMRPDPWPNLGVVIIDPEIYFESASQLKGEQNIHVPCVGSELHAAPSAPQFFPFSFSLSLPDTLVRENALGEGAGSEWRTIDIRSKPLKPPDLHVKDLQGEYH